MTGHASLLARAALGLGSVVACGALISSSRISKFSVANFDKALNLAMAASRLGVYTLLYFVLRFHARGDILGAYTPEAFATYNGLLVYRDFPSSYAPLHTYLDAALLHLWPSPLCLIFFAVCMELLLLPVWLKAARTFLPEREVRLASLLYLASPLSLQFVSVDGQDNVVVAILLAFAVLFLVQHRAALSGLLVSLSVVLFKFLPLIFLPSFSLAADKSKWKWIAAFSAPVLFLYGGFQLAGAPVLAPLGREGALRKAGCLPYVIETVVGHQLQTKIWDGLVAAALLGIVLLVIGLMQRAGESARVRVLFLSMPCFLFALVLLAKKSWPPYLMMALFPICFIVASLAPWKRFVFLAFSFLALMEHSFWSLQLREVDAPHLHQLLAAHHSTAMELFLIEVLLISGYAWLWYESLRQLLNASAAQDTWVESSIPEESHASTKPAFSLRQGHVTRMRGEACA